MLEKLWLPISVTAGRTSEFFVPEREDGGPFLFNAELAVSFLENDQGRKLFNKLFGSPEFAEKVEKTKEILSRPLSLKGVDFLKKALVGSLFEIVCFHFLQEEIKPGEVLLSPQETFALYRFLYPENSITSFYGLNWGIKGITVPDGLLLYPNQEETIIRGFCEYTLTTDKIFIPKQRQLKQFKHYQHATSVIDNLFPFGFPFRGKFLGDFLHQSHPELTAELEVDPNWQLIYITTQGKKIPNKASRNQILTVPLSSQEFGSVAHGIFQDLGVGD